MKKDNSTIPMDEIVSESTQIFPLVSIGIPVYNAESTIAACIESALAQNYANFEILISDNPSTDATSEKCKLFQNSDKRIRYFRQDRNIGGLNNFNFVLQESKGFYFRWLGSDDVISSNSLSECVMNLKRNKSLVACAVPSIFDYEHLRGQNPIDFELEGSQSARIKSFFKQPGRSHGILYGLIKRDVLITYPSITHDFFAWDWCLVLFLLSKGPIASADATFLILGSSGASSTNKIYDLYGLTGLKRVFPFWRFSVKTVSSGEHWTKKTRVLIIIKLLLFNSKSLLTEFRIVRYKLAKMKRRVLPFFHS